MKIAIVGSRNYRSELEVKEFVCDLSADSEIVSGGAAGPDSWAVEQAPPRLTKVFPADWEKYGKAAGFRRNQEIVDYADEVYAFWDGLSRGTLDTINKAAKAGKLRGIYV